jgi:hypothetical protein
LGAIGCNFEPFSRKLKANSHLLRNCLPKRFNVTKLEVLDQAFHTVWSRTVTPQDGLLVGVAADGSLYFLRGFGGTNCKLARYTLAQVGQAAN